MIGGRLGRLLSPAMLGAALAPAHAQAGDTAISADPCAVLAAETAGLAAEAADALRARRDFPNLCRYAAANAAVRSRPDIVFIGDSLTEGWTAGNPGFFSDRRLNRGISGQTSQQMLLRFYADVVALRPAAVHILAGSNDIAGNTGPTSEEAFRNNIRAMVDIARAHDIRVIIGALPPSDRFWWAPTLRPAAQIRRLNGWLLDFAATNRLAFVDYHLALSTPDGAMKTGLADDGVHPNAAGYTIMSDAVEGVLR